LTLPTNVCRIEVLQSTARVILNRHGKRNKSDVFEIVQSQRFPRILKPIALRHNLLRWIAALRPTENGEFNSMLGNERFNLGSRIDPDGSMPQAYAASNNLLVISDTQIDKQWLPGPLRFVTFHKVFVDLSVIFLKQRIIPTTQISLGSAMYCIFA